MQRTGTPTPISFDIVKMNYINIGGKNKMKNVNIGLTTWLNSKVDLYKPPKRPIINISSQRIKLSIYFPINFEKFFRFFHIEIRDNRRKKTKRSRARPTNRYQKFKRDVMEIGGYTCAKCGAKSEARLTAHHLKSFAKEPDWALDPDVSRVLCLDCHCLFHERYGYLDFTPENFFEFLNTDEEQFKHNITPRLPWWWETNETNGDVLVGY